MTGNAHASDAGSSDPEVNTEGPGAELEQIDVVDAELVHEVARKALEEIRATIDYNISGQSGLTPSQIKAIDDASPELRQVIIKQYDNAMTVETDNSRRLTDLTVKDQKDGVFLAKLGLAILTLFAAALIGLAFYGLAEGETTVVIAALGPIAVVAVGGVVNMALRNRGSAK